jgi:hypothetical protein
MSHICATDSLSSICMSLNLKVVDVFNYRFFTDLSLRLRADISKVAAHERIQHLYETDLPSCPVCKGLIKNVLSRKNSTRKVLYTHYITLEVYLLFERKFLSPDWVICNKFLYDFLIEIWYCFDH